MNNKLYIFCDIPFSGKTTLSKVVEKKLGYTRVDLDEVKFDLFGKDIKDSAINQEHWDKVYQEMYNRIEKSLAQGNTVIQDAGNFTKKERDLVRKIADKLKIKAATVFVNIPEEIAKERLLQNRSSGLRFDVSVDDFINTVKEMEIPENDEDHIIFEYDSPIDSWIKANFI